LASGCVISLLACALYAWSVIGAFGASADQAGASASAYEYSAGHITGGGTVGKSLQFNFQVQADTNGVTGSCQVKDGATKIACLRIDSLVVVGTHATFSGTALQNNTATSFTIDVDDFGETGKARDRFAVSTALGFARSGPISSGDINTHA
jgi:hypothetical protein